MILGALDARGGQKWIEARMDDQPVAYMTLLGKVLPTTISGDPDNPIIGLSDAELDSRLAAALARAKSDEK